MNAFVEEMQNWFEQPSMGSMSGLSLVVTCFRADSGWVGGGHTGVLLLYLSHGSAGGQRVDEEQVSIRSEQPVAPAGLPQPQLLRLRSQAVETRLHPHHQVGGGAGHGHVPRRGDSPGRRRARWAVGGAAERRGGPQPGASEKLPPSGQRSFRWVLRAWEEVQS